MSVKALRTQLLGAIAMVLVATLALGSSTFAWFSFNNTVTVTGMEVHTKVEDNILIAKSTWAQTGKEADNAFKTSDVDILSGLLEPVSTVDGVNYYWTAVDNVDSVGNALTEVYTKMTGDGSADTAGFLANYNHTTDDGMKGYVDYVFQLKATNTSTTAAKNINVTDITLTYGNTPQTQKAFRAAIFVSDMGTNGSTAPKNKADDMTLVTILAPESAAYMTTDSAVGAGATVPEVKAIGTKLSANATIGSVAIGETKYYQVAVRLWLEGEDNTCNNTTFATLKDKWALKLEMKFDGTAVTKLGNNASTGKVSIQIGTTLGDSKWIDGVEYKAISGKTLNGVQLYSIGTAIAADSVIYAISENSSNAYYNHPVDVTNEITFTSAP